MLASISVRFLSILTILLLLSCSEFSEQIVEPIDKWQEQQDSLWQDRDDFLSHQIFYKTKYQESEFRKYEGLWTCVRTEKNRDEKIEYPKYIDLLFAKGKAWMLDYPCSWNMQGYAEDVHFRNDSIFFSTEDRVYIEKKRIEFRGDTLALVGNRYGDESNFYLRKSSDSLVLADLKERGFNEKCFKDKWELTMIGNGASDTWGIKDGFLDHVPRIIDFSNKDYTIEGIYLANSKDPSIKFEILQFDRSYSEYYGEEIWLEVKELKIINDIEYYYSYEPVSH